MNKYKLENHTTIICSVIIPTYNRSDSLVRALQSLESISYPRHKWEVVVVDNNSSDDTKKVVFSMRKKTNINIQYVFEKRLSFTAARHAGANNAKGSFLLYIDDDVTVTSLWMENIIKIFSKNKKVGVVGGLIEGKYEHDPPSWFKYINTIWLSLYDKGTKKIEVLSVPGPNLCVRKDILLEVGGFPPDTIGVESEYNPGIIEKMYIGPGDWGLCQKVRAYGHKVIYSPHVHVYHHIPPTRMIKSWWHTRFAGEGCCNAISNQYENKNNTFQLIVKGTFSFLLLVITFCIWKSSSLLKISSERFEFKTSYYKKRAEVEFALSKNPSIAEKLWLIGINGIGKNDYHILPKFLMLK